MKTIKIKEFINEKGNVQDLKLEIQEMDLLIFQDLENSYLLGQIPYSKLAQGILRDTIVSPIEAKKIEFFSKHPKALDTILGVIRGFLGEGLTKQIKIEIEEEKN